MLAGTMLDIDHSPDPDPVHRFGVSGELDAETAPHLITGLRGTRTSATRLRIDLSGVTFIDCSGLTALLNALDEARASGRVVEVDEQVSAPVHRIIQLTRTREQIWP
jgi:anti-anti-sigma factor